MVSNYSSDPIAPIRTSLHQTCSARASSHTLVNGCPSFPDRFILTDPCRLTFSQSGNSSFVRRCRRSSRACPNSLYNILWAWEPPIRTLFPPPGSRPLEGIRLQPGRDAGPRFAGHARARRRRSALSRPVSAGLPALRRHMTDRPQPDADGKLIAYFSAEYGLTECMPVYSGGLGVLSGDHMKSSSDLRSAAGRASACSISWAISASI